MIRAFYQRVSTLEQNTDRQKVDEGLQLYSDKCSGMLAFNERPQGKRLMHEVTAGNVLEVHVHSIDRLGRSTLDIMQTIQTLTAKGVNVISNKEGLQTLNEDGTENMISKMIIGILGTLSEFEINRMKERQKEGIAEAKKRGSYKSNGRPEGTKESIEAFMNKSKTKEIIRAINKGKYSYREISKLCSCSLSTVQKVVKYSEILDVDNLNNHDRSKTDNLSKLQNFMKSKDLPSND